MYVHKARGENPSMGLGTTEEEPLFSWVDTSYGQAEEETFSKFQRGWFCKGCVCFGDWSGGGEGVGGLQM